MSRKHSRQRMIDSSFSIGSVAAETDYLLPLAYYDNGDYNVVASHDIRRSFVIGRTGSGKSAAFAHLQEQEPERVISISPENLALNYVTNLDAVRQLRDLGVHLEPFFRALWKHVFVVEVLKHRYPLQSPAAKASLLQSLRELFSSKPSRVLALNYLDEFGDRFWCETDERVIQIGEKFSERVRTAGDASAGIAGMRAGVGAAQETAFAQDTQREIVAKYQRVVNETQLARLNETIQIINDTALDSDQHYTYLVIDDLDKQWVDDDLTIPLIRCLFDAVADMSRIRNLKILIALRTNIFSQLDYGSQRRGTQEEKIQGMVLSIGWTINDLRSLMVQRVQAASEYYGFSPDLPPLFGPAIVRVHLHPDRWFSLLPSLLS